MIVSLHVMKIIDQTQVDSKAKNKLVILVVFVIHHYAAVILAYFLNIKFSINSLYTFFTPKPQFHNEATF